MKTIKKQYNLKYEVDILSTFKAAKRNKSRKAKSCYSIVMGDSLKYWVVTWCDVKKLKAAGFEVIA